MTRRLIYEERFFERELPLGILDINRSSFDLLCSVILMPAGSSLNDLEGQQPTIAKIDSGFNGGFALREEHLTKWLGRRLEDFPAGNPTKVVNATGHQFPVNTYDGEIWLRPSERLSDVDPVVLPLEAGFCYFPEPTENDPPEMPLGPVLPLLGARAFREAQLIIEIDYQRLICRIWKDDAHDVSLPFFKRLWKKVLGSLPVRLAFILKGRSRL